MNKTQHRILSLILAILAAAAVLWYTWPQRPTHAPDSISPIGDPNAIARVKAALGNSSNGTTQPVSTGTKSSDPSTGAQRIPHPAPIPNQTLQMTIKELGNFDYDPVQGGDIPPDIKALNGCPIRLKGYMWPLGQADQLTDFILVPSLTSCCFGQPPGVQHVVTTRLPAKKAVPFVVDQVWVEGTLHVKIIREEEYTSSIFEMDATSVKLAD